MVSSSIGEERPIGGGEPSSDSDSPLAGRQIVFTGRLATMNRQNAGQLVRRLGGTCATRPTERTHYVVVGEAGVPLNRQGRPDPRVEEALSLRGSGHGVEVLSEAEFLSLVDLAGDGEKVRQYYTILELHRLLRVSPTSIRAWVRSGLIEPAEVRHGLSLFDFAQVAEARALTQLLQDGVPIARIRESLQRLREHLPNVERSLSHWTLVEKNREVLVRLDDGRLSNSRGQLYFDFFAGSGGGREPSRRDDAERGDGDRGVDGNDNRILEARAVIRTGEQCLLDGLQYEAEGEWEAAEGAYREAIRTDGPSAVLCFNLGNVYYEQAQYHRALERYSLAVELEPDYAEAWNNLGNVLSDLSENRRAIEAYRQALRCSPHYADAHYNIAECYLSLDDVAEARKHWKLYLSYDPSSTWASQARARLEESERA